MRIRRCAARLLGSAYSASTPAPAPDAALPFELPLPTPPPPPACSAAPESLVGVGFPSPVTASVEPCELSRSPWDLIAELALSDPQVQDDLVDKYFVHVSCRASWLFTASMPATSVKKELTAAMAGEDGQQLLHEVSKKSSKKVAVNKEKAKKEGVVKKKAKVKEGEGDDANAGVYKCKKNDGKRWYCRRTVSQPDTLCDYHFYQKRAYFNPEFASAVAAAEAAAAAAQPPTPVAASKPSTSSKPSKPRKKKSGGDTSATEGFYYYAGFGPFRSKRHCRRSSGVNSSVPVKLEEEEPAEEDVSPMNQSQVQADGTNRAAAHHDEPSCEEDIAGIAGVDEESSDDDGFGTFSRRSNPSKKRWRKPVKARSLKSLM